MISANWKPMQKDAHRILLSPNDLPPAKKITAIVIGKALSMVSARHTESWDTAFTEGSKEGYARGSIAGNKVGYAAGSKQGYEDGYQKGFAEGRLKFEISDARDMDGARPGKDYYLFERWQLPITQAIELQMRSDVAALLPDHQQPTQDQWEMILSKTPSTYVVAGAGSGKSTTLILRIILLRYYLKYELDAMTVVTFTKKSQEDFVKKLVTIAEKWKLGLTADDARMVVCTFHAKILKFARALLGEHVSPFEFYGDKAKEDETLPTNDTPFDTRLNIEQRTLLNECYTQLYQSTPRFRALIAKLYYHSLTQAASAVDSDMMKRYLHSMRSIQERDTQSMDAIEKEWQDAGHWPIAGITRAREKVVVNGMTFEVHGFIPGGEKVAVVLRADDRPVSKVVLPGARYSIGQEMNVKRNVFSAYSNQKVIWIKNASDMDTFIEWNADRASIAPHFNYLVSGDLRSSPLIDCFVSTAAFMENLGLNVSDAVSKMEFVDTNHPDAVFFEAAATFWPAFLEHLSKQVPRVMTFNRIFSIFGEGCEQTLRLLPDSLIRSMSHLMIDEFQDISPQIVSWVRAVLIEVRRRGAQLSEGRTAQCSSLLCVGDDWQSIYGWRGSAPKYFMEFEQVFRAPTVTRIMLKENFRSHQHIIDAAEHLVASTPSIPNKKAIAAGPAAANPVPVEVRDPDDDMISELVARHYALGETVMLLYREGGEDERNRLIDLVKPTYEADRRLPKAKRRLQVMTFHKSKGLEADTVLLSGDCKFKISSPYKNHAYKLAGLGNPSEAYPYDSAQKEELLRLAYVGITRAARHCYWFPDRDKASLGKKKATDYLAGAGSFLADMRKFK